MNSFIGMVYPQVQKKVVETPEKMEVMGKDQEEMEGEEGEEYSEEEGDVTSIDGAYDEDCESPTKAKDSETAID